MEISEFHGLLEQFNEIANDRQMKIDFHETDRIFTTLPVNL